jgi:hypothetical protein
MFFLKELIRSTVQRLPSVFAPLPSLLIVSRFDLFCWTSESEQGL